MKKLLLMTVLTVAGTLSYNEANAWRLFGWEKGAYRGCGEIGGGVQHADYYDGVRYFFGFQIGTGIIEEYGHGPCPER